MEKEGGGQSMSMYGIQFKMLQRIIHKFEKVGAISEAKAVTFDAAGLDLQEQYWLGYFAGSFLGRIKKTNDNRYYI